MHNRNISMTLTFWRGLCLFVMRVIGVTWVADESWFAPLFCKNSSNLPNKNNHHDFTLYPQNPSECRSGKPDV